MQIKRKQGNHRENICCCKNDVHDSVSILNISQGSFSQVNHVRFFITIQSRSVYVGINNGNNIDGAHDKKSDRESLDELQIKVDSQPVGLEGLCLYTQLVRLVCWRAIIANDLLSVRLTVEILNRSCVICVFVSWPGLFLPTHNGLGIAVRMVFGCDSNGSKVFEWRQFATAPEIIGTLRTFAKHDFSVIDNKYIYCTVSSKRYGFY